jgi:putative hydrolase of the HAD superfamily
VRREIRSIDPIRDFRTKQAELVAAYLGLPPAGAAALIERVVYGEWLDSIRRMRPYAGMRAIIGRLRAAGLKTAVLSDLPIEKKLSYLNLEGVWDCAFSSEETGYLKPHPAPFRAMLRALGVKPEETIYIGNNYKYDVLGARELGIKTGYFSSAPVRRNVADYTFTRYSQMRRFLLSILRGA